MHPCPPCSSVNPPVAATVVSVKVSGKVEAVAPAVVGATAAVAPPAAAAVMELSSIASVISAAMAPPAAASVATSAGAGIGRAKDLFFLFFPPFLFFVSFFSFCFLRGCTLDRV